MQSRLDELEAQAPSPLRVPSTSFFRSHELLPVSSLPPPVGIDECDQRESSNGKVHSAERDEDCVHIRKDPSGGDRNSRSLDASTSEPGDFVASPLADESSVGSSLPRVMSARRGNDPGRPDATPAFARSWSVHSLTEKIKRRTESIARRTGQGAVGQFPALVTPVAKIETSISETAITIVDCGACDVVFAFVILVNTVFMCLEAQSRGLELGIEIDAVYESPWLSIDESFFRHSEVAFGIVFSVELLLKLLIMRTRFFESRWNFMDVIIVGLWVAERAVEVSFSVNPMLLRLLRMLKLVRLVKMVKAIQSFDSLRVLVCSISASFSALAWSTTFLLLVLSMEAILLCNIVQGFVEKEPDQDTQQELYMYFGTLTRAMLTMVELTLGNWVPCTRSMMEGISEWFSAFLLLHVLFVSFSVIMVIRGVFLQQTFHVAAADDELMVVQKERSSKMFSEQMERLFDKIDARDSSGFVTRDIFKRALQNPKVRTWLGAMDLEVGDADLLFDCLDDGDECISMDELVRGVPRLSGKARSIDLVALMHKAQSLELKLTDMLKTQDKLYAIAASSEGNTRNGVENFSSAGPTAPTAAKEHSSLPPRTTVQGSTRLIIPPL